MPTDDPDPPLIARSLSPAHLSITNRIDHVSQKLIDAIVFNHPIERFPLKKPDVLLIF